MLKSFEAGLRRMNDIAKAKADHATPEEDRKLIEDALATELEMLAEENRTPKSAQEAVFKQQKRKQKIMDRLKTQLAGVDNPFASEFQEIDARTIRCVDGRYLYRDDGQVREVTLGELLTDGEWGLSYHLDPASVPRIVRKRYFIEQARREMMELLNRQIVTNESQSDLADEKKSEGYVRMIAQENQEQSGKYAERMVKNLFKKLTIDHDLDFEIVDADAFQDMELKCDFLIRRKTAKRGVKVSTWNEDVVGVQFTSTDSPEIIRKKEKQVADARPKAAHEKIQDVALVSIPLHQIQTIMRRWQARQTPGGPEKLWDDGLKKDIFRKTMKKFLTDEEIDSYIEKIWPMRAAA